MVGNGLCAEQRHEPVEETRRPAFHEVVGFARVAYTVYYFVAFVELVYHAVDGVDVVLQVGIDADAGIAFVGYELQTGKQCILVTVVAREFHSAEGFVGVTKLRYDVPGVVGTAVVDEENETVVGDFSRIGERFYLVADDSRAFLQYGFLVVAGYYD